MTNCAYCSKKVSFFSSTTNWAGNHFCNEECKSKFKQNKKNKTPEEKKETLKQAIIWIGALVVMYFLYIWFIDPFGDIFGISTGWKIALAVFAYFSGVGTLIHKSNKETFYETHKHGFRSEEDATSKIAKLKELKDKGAISEKEFEKKKKELLEKI